MDAHDIIRPHKSVAVARGASAAQVQTKIQEADAMTTFERVHAATSIAGYLEEKLADISRSFVGGVDDLHTRLLICDAHIAATRALKHLLAAAQMAANAEADAERINRIAAE